MFWQKLCNYWSVFFSNRLPYHSSANDFHLQFGMHNAAFECTTLVTVLRVMLKNALEVSCFSRWVSPRDCRTLNPLEPAMTRRRHVSPIQVLLMGVYDTCAVT